MLGAPDPGTSWPGTKNARSHCVSLSEPVHKLLPDVLAGRRGAGVRIWAEQQASQQEAASAPRAISSLIKRSATTWLRRR
jgi:hypothetical protein